MATDEWWDEPDDDDDDCDDDEFEQTQYEFWRQEEHWRTREEDE